MQVPTGGAESGSVLDAEGGEVGIGAADFRQRAAVGVAGLLADEELAAGGEGGLEIESNGLGGVVAGVGGAIVVVIIIILYKKGKLPIPKRGES